MYITTLKYCLKKTVKSWGHLGSNIFEFWGVAGQAIPINDYVNPRAIITTRWHHRIRLYFFEPAVQSFFWHISALESSFSTLNDLGWPWKWYQSIALIETHRMMGIWTLPEKKIFHLSEPTLLGIISLLARLWSDFNYKGPKGNIPTDQISTILVFALLCDHEYRSVFSLSMLYIFWKSRLIYFSNNMLK